MLRFADLLHFVVDLDLERKPAAVYAEVQDSLTNWRALGYFGRTDREMIFRERGVKQFTESGTVLGMGTDSGTPMNFHTEALWREAKVHVDLGMPAIKVISALTRVGANILGKQRDLGTIEPGKLADVALWRLDDLDHAGIADPVAAIVLGARPQVDTLLVGGRPVVEEGRLVTADEEVIARELAQASRRMQEVAV